MSPKSLVVLGVMAGVICVVAVLLPPAPGAARAPAAGNRARPEFRVRGTVVAIKVADETDVIDACSAWVEADRGWAVRLRVDESLEGRIGREELTILVHSPDLDLGVDRVGQVVEVGLDRIEGEPDVFIPSDSSGGIPDLSQLAFQVANPIGR